MNNSFRSYLKEGTLEPVRYEKEINQKGLFLKSKRYKEVIFFYPKEAKVIAVREDPLQTREVPVPSQTRDPLALFLLYYLDAAIHDGDQAVITIYDGARLREVASTAASEEISTRLFGRIRTMCVKAGGPLATFNNKEGTIQAWYTDDERRFLVQIAFDIPKLGLVTFVLVNADVQ